MQTVEIEGVQYAGPLVLASFTSIAVLFLLPLMHFFIFPIRTKRGCFVFSPLLKMYYGQISQVISLAMAAIIEFQRNQKAVIDDPTSHPTNLPLVDELFEEAVELYNKTIAPNQLLKHDIDGAWLTIPMFFSSLSFIFTYVGSMEYIYASTPAYMRAVGFGFWLACIGLGFWLFAIGMVIGSQFGMFTEADFPSLRWILVAFFFVSLLVVLVFPFAMRWDRISREIGRKRRRMAFARLTRGA